MSYSSLKDVHLSWLMRAEPVFLRGFVSTSKSDCLVDKVELIVSNTSLPTLSILTEDNQLHLSEIWHPVMISKNPTHFRKHQRISKNFSTEVVVRHML